MDQVQAAWDPEQAGEQGAARIVAAVGEVVLLPVPADTASARTV